MFTPVFKKTKTECVIRLKVFGVSACNSVVIWDTPIEYMLIRYFIDNLNKHHLPEENLFNAINEFLKELDMFNQIDLKNTRPQIIRTKLPSKFFIHPCFKCCRSSGKGWNG